MSASSSIQSSLAGSSSTQQQPPVVTPPLAGPLSSSDQRTSLLVLNLPFKVRWQDVKDLFRRSAGTVLRADVSLTPDGRSRGFGSVLMRDGEDAQRAKECFDGFEWMGRKLEVHIERGGGGGWGFAPDGSPLYPTLDSSSTYGVAGSQSQAGLPYGGMPDGSYYGRTLFVGNLSYATQWQDLKDLFRAAGNILRADIALGSEGRSRGFGTALFGSKEEAARAVRMFHG
ncbi:RNA-binding domain-containing protein, partial [Jaminaea rosea]